MAEDKNSETENEGRISPKRKLSGTEPETDQVAKRGKLNCKDEGSEQNNDVSTTENSPDAGEQDGQMKAGIASNSTDKSPRKVYAECKICDKQFNGPKTYMAHLSSGAHIHKVKRLDKPEDRVEMFKCRICNTVCSGPIPYNQHIFSKTHRKQVNCLNSKMKLKDANSDEIIHPWICKICDKKFNGPIPYEMHTSSASHVKKVNASSKEPTCPNDSESDAEYSPDDE